MKQQFIKTSDEEVANELRNLGYNELNKEGKFFVFLNHNYIKNFSNNIKKKMIFTDKIYG